MKPNARLRDLGLTIAWGAGAGVAIFALIVFTLWLVITNVLVGLFLVAVIIGGVGGAYGGLIRRSLMDGKHEVQVQHKWLWAISPLTNSEVAFVAHCRSCNNTFTQRLWVPANGASKGSVDLPEWGCKNPMALL